MNNKDVHLDVGSRRKDVWIGVSGGRTNKDVSIGVSGSGTHDYNKLDNKPQINDVTLEGNKYLMDLFPDGILINCGDSNGYPEPIIPPEVPQAEGVGF